MVQVEALQQFEHYGTRKVGELFEVDPKHAEKLAGKGLVRALTDATGIPSQAAGKAPKSSASPAAQASPKPTSSSSHAGESKAKDKDDESSSPTPPTKPPAGPTHSSSSTASGGRAKGAK
jgi:hypothetical protein